MPFAFPARWRSNTGIFPIARDEAGLAVILGHEVWPTRCSAILENG